MHNPKIIAVLSCPRLGWNDFWGEAQHALNAFGIPIQTFTGAFWDQCFQNALELVLKQEPDFILTLDYDSVFGVQHVQRLIDGAGFADAVASWQLRRGDRSPMFSGVGFDSKAPFEVESAHFGLTLLSAAALRKLPKPWFIHIPDERGEYHGKQTDADEYFWKQWRAAGNTIRLDPQCRIGHLEVMVSEADENLNPRYVSVQAWRDAQNKESQARFAQGMGL